LNNCFCLQHMGLAHTDPSLSGSIFLRLAQFLGRTYCSFRGDPCTAFGEIRFKVLTNQYYRRLTGACGPEGLGIAVLCLPHMKCTFAFCVLVPTVIVTIALVWPRWLCHTLLQISESSSSSGKDHQRETTFRKRRVRVDGLELVDDSEKEDEEDPQTEETRPLVGRPVMAANNYMYNNIDNYNNISTASAGLDSTSGTISVLNSMGGSSTNFADPSIKPSQSITLSPAKTTKNGSHNVNENAAYVL